VARKEQTSSHWIAREKTCKTIGCLSCPRYREQMVTSFYFELYYLPKPFSDEVMSFAEW